MIGKAFAVALMISSAAVLSAADPPMAEIGNGQIRAKLYLPDAKDGYYRATRFDWSGYIASLDYMSHQYYGPWYQKLDASVYDFGYEGADVVLHQCTAGQGPAEEYRTNGRALGFDEANPAGRLSRSE